MHQPALDQRVGHRVEALGVELVVDEPAVGADVEALERRAAVGRDRAERLDHGRVRERPRRPGRRLGRARPREPRGEPLAEPSSGAAATREQRVGVGARPAGGDRPRQLVLGRRVAEAVDDLGEVAAAGQPASTGSGRSSPGGGSSRRRTSSSSGERASATPFSSLSR